MSERVSFESKRIVNETGHKTGTWAVYFCHWYCFVFEDIRHIPQKCHCLCTPYLTRLLFSRTTPINNRAAETTLLLLLTCGSNNKIRIIRRDGGYLTKDRRTYSIKLLQDKHTSQPASQSVSCLPPPPSPAPYCWRKPHRPYCCNPIFADNLKCWS